MKPIVKITFKSEQTPRDVYSLFLKDMKDAIALNSFDAVKLEEIRKELMEELSYVQNLQYRLGK